MTPLLHGQTNHSALVLGTGGASNAIAFVLNKLNIPYKLVSRNPKTDSLNYAEAEKLLRDYSLIINTTPVGTYPNMQDCHLNSLEGIGKNHLVYDLIYNPPTTSLLEQSSALGARTKNGQEMLEIQAEESWNIWQTT